MLEKCLKSSCVSNLSIKEIWKDIPLYINKYKVSSIGRVKSLDFIINGSNQTGIRFPIKKKGRILKQQKTNNGYFTVALCKNNKNKRFYTHNLVIMTFQGKRPFGLNINHKDGNPSNNYINNLEYINQSENVKEAYIRGRLNKKGEKHHLNKLNNNDVLLMRNLYDNNIIGVVELSRKFNISHSQVSIIVHRKAWRHI